MIVFHQERIRTFSFMTADESEEERRRRLEREARTKQLRVSLTRVTSPLKPDGTPQRGEDRRRTEREEKKVEERKRAVEQGREALPACPYCDKAFATKGNLVKHCQ